MVLWWLLIRRPDSVVFSAKPGLIGVVIAGFLLNFEKVILVEGLGVKTLETLGGRVTNALGNLTYSLLFKNAKVIYAAYASALTWVETHNKNCLKKVVPCGVDTTLFYPVKYEHKHTNKIVIGYVGSFRKVHELDFLLKIVSENESMQAILIGDGERYDATVQKASQLEITDRVEFRGSLDQTKISEVIARCNLMWAYTTKSHWGVPIKVAEYLACNKFVIASRRKEFEYLEEKSFGVLLGSNSVSEFYSTLDNECPGLLQGDVPTVAGFKYVSQNFSWSNFDQISEYL